MSRISRHALLTLAAISAAMLGADTGGAYGGSATATLDIPKPSNVNTNIDNIPDTDTDTGTTGTTGLPDTPISQTPLFDASCNAWINDLRAAVTHGTIRPHHQITLHVVTGLTARKHNAVKLAQYVNVLLPESTMRTNILATIDSLRAFRNEFANRTYSESKDMPSAASALFTIIHDITVATVATPGT